MKTSGRSCLLLALLTALWQPAPATGSVELIFDLRIAGGGKSALVNAVGDTVGLELHALVRDISVSPDAFNATQGAWQSGAIGVKGDLTAGLVSGFNLFGSANPPPVDLDGDGDLDVGAAPAANAGHWIASAGVDSNFASAGSEIANGQSFRRWLIGTATFAVTDVAGVQTQINYLPRTGAAPVFPHKYQSDSATLESIRGNDLRLQNGNPAGAGVVITGPTIWNGGGGNWSSAASWNAAIVPNNGASIYNVLIDNNGAAASLVTLDIDATVNKFTVNAGDTLIVSAGRSFTINNGASIGGEIANAGQLSITGAAAQVTGTLTGNGTLINHGSITLAAGPAASAGNITGAGNLTIHSGRALTINHVRQSALTIDGTLAARPAASGGGTSRVNALSIAGSASFDLADNKLIVTAESLPHVTTSIATGRLTTSASSGGNTHLAVATAAQTGRATFGGVSVEPTDVLVMYTYAGDANLSGNVDADDYFQIDRGYARGDSGYFHGDFNYDGQINGDDYFVIDASFFAQGLPLSTAAPTADLITAVPEPNFVGMYVVFALCRRMQRKRSAVRDRGSRRERPW